MQSRAAQFQIAHGPAVGQVAANEHRVLRLNRDIKFPIADRRLREGKIRARRRRLRRGPARQTDWEQIDILKELTVGQCDIACDSCAADRSDDFDVRVRSRG